jgi:protein-S-isoprenylcysteine O-methyltransferase Ste14
MNLLVWGRIAFAIISSIVIVIVGGGSSFLSKPVGMLYLLLWGIYWLVQATRQTGEQSIYDKQQRVVYASGVIVVPILIGAVPYEYIHFNGPIQRDGIVAWFGLSIFAFGIILLAIVMKALGRFYTSKLGIQSDHTLITTGPYRVIRHPGYLAEIISMFGMGLSMSSLLGLALAVMSVILVLIRIRYEEEMLLNAFGEDYKTYMRKTMRLIPFIY